jgi:hypothetical protein
MGKPLLLAMYRALLHHSQEPVIPYGGRRKRPINHLPLDGHTPTKMALLGRLSTHEWNFLFLFLYFRTEAYFW